MSMKRARGWGVWLALGAMTSAYLTGCGDTVANDEGDDGEGGESSGGSSSDDGDTGGGPGAGGSPGTGGAGGESPAPEFQGVVIIRNEYESAPEDRIIDVEALFLPPSYGPNFATSRSDYLATLASLPVGGCGPYVAAVEVDADYLPAGAVSIVRGADAITLTMFSENQYLGGTEEGEGSDLFRGEPLDFAVTGSGIIPESTALSWGELPAFEIPEGDVYGCTIDDGCTVDVPEGTDADAVLVTFGTSEGGMACRSNADVTSVTIPPDTLDQDGSIGVFAIKLHEATLGTGALHIYVISNAESFAFNEPVD